MERGRRRLAWICIALLAVSAGTVSCAAVPLAMLRERRHAGGGNFLAGPGSTPPSQGAINPGVTGPAIPPGRADQGDWEVALAPGGQGIGKLVIFFPGSGTNPGGYMKIMKVWQAAGYHVLGVTLKAEAAGLNSNCTPAKRLPEPECFDAARAESAFGQGVMLPDGSPGMDSPHLAVDAGASAANRTFALLDYVVRTRPGEGWTQFTKADCKTLPSSSFCPPDWSKVAIAGHSQGGGLALYFAKFFPLAAVGMISAPQDFWVTGGSVTPAGWVASGRFATPASRFAGLVHRDETEYDRDVKSWAVLGMTGPLADASAGRAKLAATQKIVTTIAPACRGIALVQPGVAAHGATAFNRCTDTSLAQAWVRLVSLR